MQLYGIFVVLLAVVLQVRGVRRITLDDDSQALCKKYKMMCKTDKICAVQHFDWPSNITIPVCIPLSFVPVRSSICKQPPDTGRCLARYIRWYYNIHSQGCTHFQYGGCEGNQNNFMSKTECEKTCVSTPSIRLYESGQSALVQPSIMSAPVYEPPQVHTRVEGLNSVREPVVGGSSYDRYEILRRRPNKSLSDEASITRTRRRLDKEREKEKERKRREKKKEKKRLKKMRREQRKLRCKKRRERGKTCKKDRKGSKKRKTNKRKTETPTEVENETKKENNGIIEVSPDMVEETKNIINNEIEAIDDDEEKDNKGKKRDKRRKKRKLRDKRRHESERSRRNLKSKKADSYSKKLFSILEKDRQYPQQENSLIHTLS